MLSFGIRFGAVLATGALSFNYHRISVAWLAFATDVACDVMFGATLGLNLFHLENILYIAEWLSMN